MHCNIKKSFYRYGKVFVKVAGIIKEGRIKSITRRIDTVYYKITIKDTNKSIYVPQLDIFWKSWDGKIIYF